MVTRLSALFLTIMLILCSTMICYALPDDGNITSLIIYDNTFNVILYEKEASAKIYPASITKVMTALIVLENTVDLESTVTASLNAVSQNRAGGSTTGILEGEELTYRQLIDALLIRSGNEVSYILAEAVAGRFDEFVSMMNRKALYLGLTGTSFINPCGLHETDHYSTAADLLKLAVYAMKNPIFSSAVSKTDLYLPPTNKHTEEGWADAKNTNLLLSDDRYSSAEFTVTGIKTGSTPFAGYCLMSSVILRSGSEVYGIVIGAPDEDSLYVYNRALYEDIREFYEEKLLFGTDEIFARLKYEDQSVPLFASGNVTVTVPKGYPLSDIEIKTIPISEIAFPIYPDTPLGTINVLYSGRVLSTYNLVSGIYIENKKETQSSETVSSTEPENSNDEEQNKAEQKSGMFTDSIIVKFLLAASSALFLLIIFTVIKEMFKEKKRRKSRG